MFDKKAYQRDLMRKRRADAKAASPSAEPPAQHAAHVAAWLTALDSFARLDYRASLRRALTPARKPIAAADLARAGL